MGRLFSGRDRICSRRDGLFSSRDTLFVSRDALFSRRCRDSIDRCRVFANHYSHSRGGSFSSVARNTHSHNRSAHSGRRCTVEIVRCKTSWHGNSHSLSRYAFRGERYSHSAMREFCPMERDDRGERLRWEIHRLGMDDWYPLPLRGTAARTQPLRFARALATMDPSAEMNIGRFSNHPAAHGSKASTFVPALHSSDMSCGGFVLPTARFPRTIDRGNTVMERNTRRRTLSGQAFPGSRACYRRHLHIDRQFHPWR